MKSIAAVTALCVLGGCAAMNRLDSDVSTYSRWPADRKPSTYAFERLPSQQAKPEQQQKLEDAARAAVEAAGFKSAADPKAADVTVQVGARITATDRSPFDDPMWWGPGFGRPFFHTRVGRPYYGAGWRWGVGSRWDDYNYEREVAVLIRDRRSGEPLYEARANSDGLTPMVETALPAMFAAALKDFPSASESNPRRVTVDLKPAPG